MAIPTKMKPETIARRAADEAARKRRETVDRYERSVALAQKAYEDYLRNPTQLNLEFANDWVEGANRWAARAKELGVELAPVPPYQAIDQ